MLSNFNKVFNNPLPQPKQKIPESYARYLSESLPEGLSYLPTEGGACTIVSDDGKFTIGGLRFDPTEAQKKDLGENYSFDDVLNYIDNSQQPMKLTPLKPGKIVVNGNEIGMEQLIVYPFLNITTSGSLYMMYPNKFPAPSAIVLSGGGYEYSLNISRVKNNSINIQVYESEKIGNPISIHLSRNIKNNEIEFSLNCNPQAAKTVKELATCMTIYNDFIDGKGKINGRAIPGVGYGKKIDSVLIAFWTKVMKIAIELGVDFVPTDEKISQFTVCSVERVYQNLVNHIPVRDPENVVNVLKVNEFRDASVCLDELVGTCIGFAYEAVEEFEFFGNHFKLQELVGISNAVIESVTPKEGGGNTIILKDKSPSAKRYVSVLGFRSQDELDEFRKNHSDDLMNILSNAKSVTDFI